MKAVIFDLDETILDRSTSLIDFLQWQVDFILRDEVVQKKAFVKRFIELDNHGKLWKDKVYSALISEFKITGWTAQELLQLYELSFCAFCKPKPNVMNAITSLYEAGYQIGLISNGISPFQERNFYALGVQKYFSSILVSDAVGIRKPEAAIFELGCRALGVDKHKAVYIGDNPIADIKGAKAAGLKTIFIPSRLVDQCELADEICADFSLLPGIVDKLVSF